MRLVADTRAVFEQQLHDVHMAAFGSAREGGHAILRNGRRSIIHSSSMQYVTQNTSLISSERARERDQYHIHSAFINTGTMLARISRTLSMSSL